MKIILSIISLLIVLLATPQPTPTQNIIQYEVLKQWTFPMSGFGGIGMDILVSEKATKDEVLNLARYLRTIHGKGGIMINIFDSKEAYLNRENLQYPEKKYFRHFLVQITKNPVTGFDKIEWVAEGRDH